MARHFFDEGAGILWFWMILCALLTVGNLAGFFLGVSIPCAGYTNGRVEGWGWLVMGLGPFAIGGLAFAGMMGWLDRYEGPEKLGVEE